MKRGYFLANLDEDPGEKNDRSKQNPEIVNRLKKLARSIEIINFNAPYISINLNAVDSNGTHNSLIDSNRKILEKQHTKFSIFFPA